MNRKILASWLILGWLTLVFAVMLYGIVREIT